MNPVPSLLSIQDMSAVGRCSLTVFIPIVSALGCQAVPLPTAVFCNHLDYPHFAFNDETPHLLSFADCWEKNAITFDAIQSGFLASPEQVDIVLELIRRFGNRQHPVIVDPAMADDGHLYSIFDDTMVRAMRKLVSQADVIKPNYTEALFLLDRPYDDRLLSKDEIHALCRDLAALGPSNIVMSGLPAEHECLVAVYNKDKDILQFASTPLLPYKAHGTGDIFTAVLTGSVVKGDTLRTAAQKAASFTTKAMQFSYDALDGNLRDGLLIEALLSDLVPKQ